MKPTEEELKRYKETICQIAKAFDVFCCEHDLRYFAIGGTAIGALRHKGIIPWDDDIDFVMPRPDYERFLKLAPSKLSRHYEVLSHQSHPEYHLQFAKMCDANTSLLVDSRSHCMMGAFIDIFPMDGLPDGSDEEKRKYFNDYLNKRFLAYSKRLHFHFTDYFHSLYRLDFIEIKRQLASDIHHLLNDKTDPYEECDRITMTYSYENSEYVAYFGTNHGPKVISPRKWFETYFYVPFENIQLRLPIGIDSYLKQVYGTDYMQLPPESKREARHSFYYLDLDKRDSYMKAVQELAKSKRRI